MAAFHAQRLTYHLSLYREGAGNPMEIVAASLMAPENYALLRELSVELSKSPHQATRAACLKILLLLIKEKLEIAANDELSLLQQAKMLIVQSLTNPQLSVSLLASQLGCHADYLSREFSRREGRTLRSYIRDQRMLLACDLLQRRRLEIQDVARLCGYSDHAYFSAEFRRHHSLTPGAYRKKLAANGGR